MVVLLLKIQQKYDTIDAFSNSAIIFKRKASPKIISWISVLLIGSILLILTMILYQYDVYSIYYAKVVNNDEVNHLEIVVDDRFIQNENRNYLEINGNITKCHLLSVSGNYYLLDGVKYWNVIYECNLPSELNINNNVIEVKMDMGKQTLLEVLKNKIRKVVHDARIRN